ncbi:MAG: folylpolyglutamate synthase/dihydrofolate synthase family protein [Clostridia bacterium]|nr:folylpolyglutamate synthase/dihydrofolate synthase family protein [Clostridia bacterium]
MDIRETLRLIHQVDWTDKRPGLARIRELMARLGDPQDKLRFVHIAGTNGKGSTAAMLAAILQSAGYKTGLFTSPYITRFNERMRVNGAMITDETLIELTESIRPHLVELSEAPTEFEMITAVAFLYFFKQQCDVVVLEAGLGGRLDSTNVIGAPEAVILTAIGLDHTELLGDTIEKIAMEKAAIIKAGTSVVLSDQSETVLRIVQKKCEAVCASLTVTDPSRLTLNAVDGDGLSFDYKRRKALHLRLSGAYQMQNAAAALDAADILAQKGFSITGEAIRDGLDRVTWPGRFEVLKRAPLVILDGAHNPNGMAALSQSLRLYFPGKKITFVMGALKDKDYQSMIGTIAPLAKRCITVQPQNARALSSQALKRAIQAVFSGEVMDAGDVKSGLDTMAQLCGKDDVVCVCGSLYMVSEVRAYFGKTE